MLCSVDNPRGPAHILLLAVSTLCVRRVLQIWIQAFSLIAPGLQVFHPYFCFDCCCLLHCGLLLTLATAILPTSCNCLYPSDVHLHWKACFFDYSTLSVSHRFTCFFSETKEWAVFFVLRFDEGYCLLDGCGWVPLRGHLREVLERNCLMDRTLCLCLLSFPYMASWASAVMGQFWISVCLSVKWGWLYGESNAYESILLHELQCGV